MAKKRKTAAQKLASKGGKARAAALTPAERQEIGRRAVNARWAKDRKITENPADKTQGPVLPYSMFRGSLEIGQITVECHVLNDLRRVLTQKEVVRLLSASTSPPGAGSGRLTPYLDSNPLIDKDLVLEAVVKFRVPGSPKEAHGFEGTLLIDLCSRYLEADEQGQLKAYHRGIVRQANAVVRACAKVGIVALIDEATGYQKIRARNALQLKLQAFIVDEIGEWAKVFPDEFWIELARLEGIKYSPRNRPIRWGRYVMMFVYDAVDKDVGRELRKKNPDPHFMKNHHQWLKAHGREKVNNQLQRVIGIMQTCASMDEFRHKFAYIFKVDPTQFIWEDWLRPPA